MYSVVVQNLSECQLKVIFCCRPQVWNMCTALPRFVGDLLSTYVLFRCQLRWCCLSLRRRVQILT